MYPILRIHFSYCTFSYSELNSAYLEIVYHLEEKIKLSLHSPADPTLVGVKQCLSQACILYLLLQLSVKLSFLHKPVSSPERHHFNIQAKSVSGEKGILLPMKQVGGDMLWGKFHNLLEIPSANRKPLALYFSNKCVLLECKHICVTFIAK